MKFDARGGISILQLIFYAPSLLAAIFLCVKHGFGRNSGWIYLAIFTLVRVIGACCELATYSNESKNLYEWTGILESVGLSPLLLATLGFLSRAADSVNARVSGRFSFGALHFKAIQVLITVGLILAIVGGTNSTITPDGQIKFDSTSKIGIILFIVAYVAVVLVTGHTFFNTSTADQDDRRLVVAVALALPLILIRLIYSILSLFSHSRDFNMLGGKVVIWVFMAVVEEFAVVGIYLFAGYLAPVLPPSERGPISARTKHGMPGAPAGQAPRSRGFKASRGGLIGNLVGMAIDAAGDKRETHANRRGQHDVEAGRR